MTRFTGLCRAGQIVALAAGATLMGSVRFLAAQTPDSKAVIAEFGLEEAKTPVRDLPGWQRPKKIMILGAGPAELAQLQAAAPGVELVAIKSRSDAKMGAGADAIIGSCSPDLLAVSDRIHWVQSLSAGVEQCVALPPIKQRRILLTNMQRIRSAPIAEHALAMMLALSRRLDGFMREQARGHWNKAVADSGLRELGGKTALIVGLGGIGTEIAKRAHALGMKVTATRHADRNGPDYVSYVGLPDEMLKLAKEADVIFNAAPLTPATTNLFNAEFFATLKPTALFINVARGRSVVTADLIEALRSGRLAGAGLDVTDPEPLPDGHPLWSAPHVIITPHIASDSDLPDDKVWAVVTENLRRYVAGEKMLSVVDPDRGY
jgi:phosphoglycerate dehydrogenase-like enzyme